MKLGVYDPSRAAQVACDLIADSRVLDVARSLPINIESFTVGKRVMIINVHGPGHEADAVLWLESDERRYRGPLEAMPPAPLAFGRRTRFLWGVYALARLAPGTYRVGVGVDDGTSPAVLWSDYWVTVD
jgi:hypothetical protein